MSHLIRIIYNRQQKLFQIPLVQDLMKLHVAAAFGVLLPHPPEETADFGDIALVLEAGDDQGKDSEEKACDFEAAHQDALENGERRGGRRLSEARCGVAVR